jgi:hypothetical protein
MNTGADASAAGGRDPPLKGASMSTSAAGASPPLKRPREEVPYPACAEQEGFSVGTSVTLQRMTDMKLNGVRATVAPPPPGSSVKPGRVLVKLVVPVAGVADLVQAPADKLVSAHTAGRSARQEEQDLFTPS